MKTMLLIASFIFSTSILASGDHGHSHGHSHGHGHSHAAHPVSKEKTIEIGKAHVARLVKIGKINSSWKSAEFNKTEKKKFGKRMEWVVSFKNDKGVKGKMLYIFLKESGKYVAANFTGK